MTLRVILACDWRGGRRELDTMILDVGRREVIRGGATLRLYPARHRLFTLLAVRFPHLVHYGEMIEWLWGDDADGGPLTAMRILHLYLHHLRRDTDHLGFYLPKVWGQGVRLVDALAQRAAA